MEGSIYILVQVLITSTVRCCLHSNPDTDWSGHCHMTSFRKSRLHWQFCSWEQSASCSRPVHVSGHVICVSRPVDTNGCGAEVEDGWSLVHAQRIRTCSLRLRESDLPLRQLLAARMQTADLRLQLIKASVSLQLTRVKRSEHEVKKLNRIQNNQSMETNHSVTVH